MIFVIIIIQNGIEIYSLWEDKRQLLIGTIQIKYIAKVSKIFI